jgi:hypothetical protein
METQDVIEGWRGVMVAAGLGSPFSRALTAGIAAGTLAYAVKYPTCAFKADGSMRPYYRLSASQDATNRHFLLMPLTVAGAVYLFT